MSGRIPGGSQNFYSYSSSESSSAQQHQHASRMPGYAGQAPSRYADPRSNAQRFYTHSPAGHHNVSPYAQGAASSSAAANINATRPGHPAECYFRKIHVSNGDDALKFSEFIMNLDHDAYNKRFSDLPRNSITLRDFQKDTCIAIFNGTRMVGFADYSHDYLSRERCAHVNMVIKRDYQGFGLGKRLMDLREMCLREDGYQYKSGAVYKDNVAQIERLLKTGWEVTEHDHELIHFKKKI